MGETAKHMDMNEKVLKRKLKIMQGPEFIITRKSAGNGRAGVRSFGIKR